MVGGVSRGCGVCVIISYHTFDIVQHRDNTVHREVLLNRQDKLCSVSMG